MDKQRRGETLKRGLSQVGSYRGVKWRRLRLCDVFHHLELSQLWYFIDDGTGCDVTGDHFKTQKDMFLFINENIDELVKNAEKA